MKDTVITVRLPRATRVQVEELARQEGRSLSQQVERLIQRGLSPGEARAAGPPPRTSRSLAGVLRAGQVPPELGFRDFRRVRRDLAGALTGRAVGDGQRRR